MVSRVPINGAYTGDTILHAFRGSLNGGTPPADLFMDAKGDLYSATSNGGGGYNLGTVYEVSRGGKERVLSRFMDGVHDGFCPEAEVICDPASNLYGTITGGRRLWPQNRFRNQHPRHRDDAAQLHELPRWGNGSR